MNDRLYRSTTDRVFSGLCGGMADHFDVDPSLVRLAWVVLDVLTGIFPLLVVYIVMAMVVPEEPPVGVPGQWANWNAPRWGPGAPGGAGAPLWGPGATAGTGAPGGTGASGAQPEGAQPSQPADQAEGEQPGTQGAGGEQAGGEQAGGPWGPWGPPPPIGSDWRTARAYARAQRRAQRAYLRQQRWSGDPGTAGLIFGVILVLVGGVFLIGQTVPNFNTDLFWPVALIVVGALLLAGAFRR